MSVYDADVSEVYDLFYGARGKDFAAEAAGVARVALDRRPGAVSLLDVGCGTGEHLSLFTDHFKDVAGLELSAAMRAVALRKTPHLPIYAGDMRDFDLSRTFDVVCCLTSTVGYLAGPAELAGAVRTMARHLSPGGVLVIDPYWTPERFLDGHLAHDHARGAGRTIVRVSLSTRAGERVRNEAHYLVAGADGIRHFTHAQTLTLFRHEDYLAAVTAAGLTGDHLTGVPAYPDRGLYVGVRRTD